MSYCKAISFGTASYGPTNLLSELPYLGSPHLSSLIKTQSTIGRAVRPSFFFHPSPRELKLFVAKSQQHNIHSRHLPLNPQFLR